MITIKKNAVAVLPVAGIGKRLRPHTHAYPKALVGVAGKPILGHIVDSIIEQGIDEFVFIIGYLGDKIKEYVSEKYPDVKASYVEQKERLGLGHAIYLAKDFVKKPMLIIFGDTIFNGSLKSAFNNKFDGVLGVKEVDDPRRFGVVEVDKQIITKLVEKPNVVKRMPALVGVNYIQDYKGLFNSLKYIIDNNIKTKNEFQLTDAFQNMVENNAKLSTFNMEGWFDCGKPETLLDTNRFLLDQKSKKRKSSVSRKDNSIIIPPVYIGENVDLKDCVIGPYVSIEDNSKLTDVIIKNSIVNSSVELDNLILKDSIIGSNAKVSDKKRTINIGDNSELIRK